MQWIVASLQPGDRSEAVGNLQDAWRAVVYAGYLNLELAHTDVLLSRLGEEHADHLVGEAPGVLVELFKKQEGLGDSNQVDEAVAE
jgi:hypothetical protein